MAYYTLIASLPHLPVHFDVERPPISRPRLHERLQTLKEEDAKVLERLDNFLAWDRQPVDRSDEEVVAAYRELTRSMRNPVVLEIVNHRIDSRTLVGALRRRRDGLGAPIGVGRLVEPIRRHWSHPQFNLQRHFPWIEPLMSLILAGKVGDAERLLFEVTWTTWSRMSARYAFSFETVLLYVARWAIVERWTSRDAVAGRARFEELIEETLSEYASIQF